MRPRSLARRGLHRLGYEVVRSTPDPGLPVPADLDAETAETVRAVAPYTLTGPERIAALVDAVRYVVRAEVPGALAECGVWRGGSALAVLRTLVSLGVTDRDVWLYDTFTAMPSPTDRDVDLHGNTAAEYHAQYAADPSVLDPAYDYLPLPEVRAVLLATGYPEERLHLVQGLVEDTVPAQAPDQLALLRLDTDYYTSTRHELEHLAPRLSPGGVLLVDDYGHWRGSRDAVDEWMTTLPHPLLLQRIDYTARLVVMPGSW
ncbi:MAG: methyltransferase [Frankiales bacterium]|jgi:O-methyltransferase|nr:methyltransferase [Frankiales bacterium]MCW2586703.1 methyltransferase [Frankiales bacterium]